MHKRNGPQAPPGRGAVTARQLGLLVDFSPDGLMIPEDGVNDEELEAEFLALVGGQPQALEKLKGKGPLPMEAIEKMARLCMRDLDEDEEGTDEDVEADEDLLAELNEVLGEERKAVEPAMPVVQPKPSSPNPGIEATLQERLILYQSAVESARQAGDSAKMRRYDRGLKTLENLLVSAKKGNTINEADIPPPVASGKGPAIGHSHTHTTSHLAPVSPPAPEPSVTLEAPSTTAQTSAKPQLSPDPCSPLARLQSLQHEYKVAALRAKHQDDTATAARYLRVSKSFDPVLEALSRGELVDLSRLPPPPDQLSPEPPLPAAQPVTPASTLTRPEVPQPPKNLLEALEQRMERYHVAAAQAKAKGDQRKARMHERIVKQYQDAIRAHKAGRAVDVAELPVPPGFPPIQGLESAEPSQQSLVGVLETAMKLANHEEGSDEEEEETPKKNTPAASTAQPKASPSRAPPSGPAPAGKAASKGTSTRAQQQLAFLEGRKKQLLQAALRAKQKNDVEGAKMHLRQAKGLEPMLEASRNGLPVDIAKVPPAPVNKDDFVLVQRPGPGMSQEAVRRYGELTKLLRQQHEMCLNHSTQFTHLGNIAETIKFEKLAEDCKRSMDTLKQAFARSLPTPAARFEQRTFSVIKIFPDLSNNDMLLFIVKGINLPTPPGLSPSDLDAFVRFDFPYPNVEEAQKDKTSVIKSTDSPEFKEQFKLCINRGHRGFRRAIQTKGIKFEVVHKGGLFKTDRVLGTAQLKLDTLETACEVHEILEVLDGRRPTGGRLEVMVRIREPLTAQQLETTTERWLVIDHIPAAVPTVTGPKAKVPLIPASSKEAGNRSSRPLHSLSVLAFDQERLERKILALRQARRPVPPEVAQQYQDVVQRSQWQRAQLEQGGAALRREYASHLERQLHFYTEAARRLGYDGSREAAKEALYRRNLVESELQRLRR
ncbi:coiled-coil and C2 domain-containing protein 1A isoform X5 [Rattus norvegicus]|uniref:Coiled-coil and C2 domain-containing protein 1A n=1 Tax=Rattus norvegicus TaxID=10116 RepID=C2D1A_RAT|nr:coiled-coil and C2 domain-containing protein 1A isoform X5 [Rattus norvegicus]Q66HA5.2 RecName: Full=Coiled-coil and C2 domain-containing protein 1A; AltName: Full=Five prime repressor element under dual repression-binding protein 1; Short=FRE under dual repression-binding protein 1; Short=Freud-1 [Rattus norvegicus]|eukprot:XP_006255296.1 PREDICTED: coiled-coil and C2 domain-containing protein 1A isoform X2 [Rattus norvegicus]